MRCFCLAGLGLLVALPSVGGVTLSEDFGDEGLPLGLTAREFPAAELVGPNRGSIFFDIVLGAAQEPRTGRRSLVCLRTRSRFSISWASYGNDRLQFEFSDRTHCYYVDFLKNVEKDRTYRLGATWDGEAVRVYLDGRVIHSAPQPCAVKAAVDKLYLGPFEDKWLACKPWADDVRIRNLRVWDEARNPQDVATECGVTHVGPDKALPAVLTVPKLADGVAAPAIDGKGDDAAWNFAASLPQLIECVDRGKSGRMPSHGFRVTYDDRNLYFLTTTLFPGRISYEEGVARTPDFEPETYSAESFEFQLAIGGHVYRFSANALGGTTERIDKDRTWNGPWTYSSTRAMQIDDSVVWAGEAAIPWTSLGFDTAPGPQEVARLNFARTWTLSTFGVESCLDFTGRSYAPTENCPQLVFAPAGPAYHLERRTDPAAGSYAEDFVLASGRRTAVTYRIDLAKRDGSFAPMSVFSKGYQLEAGKPISETLKVATTVPGYDAIVHTLEENGEVVMRETVPYDLDEEIFTLTPLLLQGKLRVVYKRPFSGSVVVTDALGREVSKTAATGGTQVLAFSPENASGKYVLSLVDEGGKTVSSRTFDYPGLGEWSRQDFHEDWILPPFSPMRTVVERNAFGSSLALRVYGWRNSFLLNRVKALGEDLFAAPPQLLIGGEAVGCDSLEVVSNAPHHVGFVSMGRASGAASRCSGWLEYDGVQFNRVTVRPDRATGEVAVRYRLKPAFGKYLHAAKGGSWGSKRTLALADGTTVFGAFPVLWIGNEEKGFCFFYETRADWTSEPTRTYDVEKSADGVTVTVHVAKALPAGKEFAFEFGFLASPVKPLEANHPFNAPSWSHTSVMNRPGRRPTADISALHCDEKEYPGGDLGSFFCDQNTEESRKVNARYRWTLDTYEKGNGTRPVSYSSARYLSVKYPEVAAYLPEWTFRPEIAMDYQHTGHYVYDCCPTTKANDFFIWKVKGLFRMYPELKGWFCDFGTIHGCSNEDHGCREKTPLLGQREFYRRIIVAQLEAGIRTPLLLVHNTDCVQLPALTFVTNLENGEHVRQASSSLLHDKKDILDTYGLEMFACELSSLPWGIANNFYMPYDTLSKENGGDEETEPYQFRMGKASIGMGLVHHTMQELLRNHFGIFDKVFRIYDGFGVDKAKFTGYWRHPATVRGGKDVLVSCYVRDRRVLAVIAHSGREHVDQDVEIDFDFASLGLPEGPSVATDLLTAPDPDYDWLFKQRQETKSTVRRVTLALGDFGTKVQGFDGKTLRYHIPFHSFGIVELKPGEDR